jgi:N-methylhydantoinase A/oxoprolinase/acetone carboxylase beta subunit
MEHSKHIKVIGIDVGGTNTDAVLISAGRIIKRTKTPTTPDVEAGILSALAQVCGGESFDRVHIGTTAFTNALVERKHLAPSAAIRIGAPVSESLPPMIDWPADLVSAVENPVFFVQGGREYTGRPIRKLKRSEIQRVAAELLRLNVTQVAITAVFGTVYPEDELQVAAWLKAETPGLNVSLSHQIGRFGILERENATLINAMLQPLAARTVAAYHTAISGAIFISQNDGTAMRTDRASDMPVLTIASGPTNSLRGAAMLTGLHDAIVFDVGGTTTDVGVLHGGFPQVASLELEVAGVRTNFRMPDIASIGVGGGSLICQETGAVGPKSVGHRLVEEALVFGGATLTLTDIAVAAKRIEIGDSSRVKGIRPDLIQRVDEHLRARFKRLVDNFEKAGQRLPIVLVGGGAPLVSHLLQDQDRVMTQPECSEVANAFGASIAQVSGEADLTFSIEGITRAEALKRVEQEAHARAVMAGARPGTIRTIELEDAALSYLASDAMRVRAKAVGDLEIQDDH